MKQLKTLLTASCLLGFALAGNAQYFSDDTFNYQVVSEEDATCIITGFGSYMELEGATVDGVVELPSTVDNYGDVYTVIGIGDNAFQYLNDITSFLLPENLETIGECAFFCCGGLNAIDLPEKVVSVGYMAYANCPNIASIKIGKNMAIIDDYAFADLPALKSIRCEASLPPEIGEDTFSWDLDKSTVILSVPEESMEAYAQSDWKGFDIQAIAAEAPYVESVEVVGVIYGEFSTEAPYTCNVTGHLEILPYEGFTIYSIVEANGHEYAVKGINESVFKGYKMVGGEVVIEDGIETIGDNAFNGFSAKGIRLPSTLLALGTRVFYGCLGLEAITVPGSLSIVPENTFAYCKAIQHAVVEEGVAVLGKNCFKECASLADIALPSTLQTIGESAFEECGSLSAIELPESVNEIGAYAFYGCASLTSIEFPETITEIAGGLFSYSGLTEFSISPSVTAIGDDAFEYCLSLQHIEIPGSVKTIGVDAFSNCEAMKTLVLNDGIESLDDNAFYECRSLTDVEIPESVRRIGLNAFTGCDNLAKTVINASIIERSAFNRCEALKHLTLGEKVESIGESAFVVSDLTDIDVLAIVPPALDSTAFTQATYSEAVLTVPDNCIESYSEAEGWSKFQLLTTGIAPIPMETTLRIIGGTVTLSESARVKVVDLSGRTLMDEEAEAGATIRIPGDGFRVLKVGNHAKAIM